MSNKEIFSKIYKNEEWGGQGDTPLSGPGSSLWYTEQLRSAFPGIIEQFNVKTLFDAGCGDLTWMGTLVDTLDIKYIGADVVDFLIEKNRAKFPNLDLRVMDITVDPLPQADMMLCRDCMFHMSFKDIYATLNNFLRSGTPLLFTTCHDTPAENVNITTGGYAELNFKKHPFNFPDPVFSINDTLPSFVKRNVCIWTRDQIITALKNLT
jgi:hypothetical protein